jgi:tetratricopeptide (TPR) repeat protein
MEYYEKALEIAEEQGYVHEETRAYQMFGEAYKLNNQIQKGMEYYEKALEIAKERGYKHLENSTRNVIEKLSKITGKLSNHAVGRQCLSFR